MDFKDYLKEAAGEIDKELEIFFKKWSKEVKAVSPKLIGLNKTFIQACEGGKRLRGALVKLGYEMVGNPSKPLASQDDNLLKEIIKPAAAFEIFQTAILDHDDIVDLSPLRRGKPTIYKALGGNHYGISQALTLGDIGYFLAVRLIAQSDFPQNYKNKALSFFSQAMLETALGQMLDIELPYRKESRQEKEAITIFRLKTARYTIVGPLHLGAILGGADQKTLDDIEVFGEALGIAFQIQDDILGVFGSLEQTGKSVTSDIEEGKNTLLIIQALKKASAEQNKILKDYYGKGRIETEELEKIKKIFIDTGALEYSQKKAEKLVSEAKKIIPQLTSSSKQKNILSQMADLLVKRDK